MFVAYATIHGANSSSGPPLLLRSLGVIATACATFSTWAALHNISTLNQRYKDRIPPDWPPLIGQSGLHSIGHAAPFFLYFGIAAAWIFWD